MAEKENILLISCSETDSNMYYATKFLAPDPFIFVHARGKSFLLMSDLEVDRARAQSRVDEVLSYSDYEERAKKKGRNVRETADVVQVLLEEQGVKELTVPTNFPLEHADALRTRGFTLSTKKEPFFEERAIKTSEEVDAIRKTQIAVEEAVEEAMNLLRRAEIKNGQIYLEGKALTSESVRSYLHLRLMERDCIGQHTIIACGVDACDPHNEGTGPLRANEPIIFDVFPRSSESRYFADMSRTVVKGRPSDGLKKLYDTVLEGQELGIRKVKAGASGKAIHEEIVQLFDQRGYHTGKVGGRMQGFFHGTGHGVGLDIHEPPRISRADWTLKEGEVVTVEPGLYYPEIGAVRIEDMVLVEKDGCRNLTTYPKKLEID
ncbi:MAG: aminopeptidase P family protein [Nitrospirae bacterium]|nr:aminopeptidase P family protein [Candidatus Manganitrophaceae bacterium]